MLTFRKAIFMPFSLMLVFLQLLDLLTYRSIIIIIIIIINDENLRHLSGKVFLLIVLESV